MRIVTVIDATTGETLASQAVVAESFWARFLGLQGKRALAPGNGLILLPTNSIHMFFMRFPIDAIFVNGQGSVLRIARHLRPWTIGPFVREALYCIELPAGAAARTDAGHVIELQETSAR